MNKDEIVKDINKYRLLYDIVDRLVYPEKYVKTDEWLSGDGPFEEYCNKLQEKAIEVLKRIDI